MGWPSFLLEPMILPSGTTCLTLLERTGKTERQWKGMMSWMLGVAGARHVILKHEQYRWIAPVSAFYAANKEKVELTRWPKALPPGLVETRRPPRSKVRLTPDYLVLRSTAKTGAYDWRCC